jgi:signal peptidase II
VVLVLLLDTRLRFLTAFGLSLFCGGSISNLIDRIAFGRVVDFLKFDWGLLQPYIFNVADMAIGIGSALTLVGAACAFVRLVSRGLTPR